MAIVLIDARKGVLIQSRRHAYITALLGVRNIIVAVNKMDLVGYDEQVFAAIEHSSARYTIARCRFSAALARVESLRRLAPA